MSSGKEKILIKLTGNIFTDQDTGKVSSDIILNILQSIKKMKDRYSFGLLIGGGNIFRGSQHGSILKTSGPVSHELGMMATAMNGMLATDLARQAGLSTIHFSAAIPGLFGSHLPSSENINHACGNGKIIIFSGGIGVPFFTSDTGAMVRALQMGATQVWKGTNVEGVYDKDPHKYKNAKKISHLTYKEALHDNIAVMDREAYVLAEQHNITTRVFNIFAPNILEKVVDDKQVGSTIV